MRTCSEKGAGRLARCHGAAVPTNAQVRAASGSGLGSAREAAPGARDLGDCHCGDRAFPLWAAPHLSAPSGMSSGVRGGRSVREVLGRVAPAPSR